MKKVIFLVVLALVGSVAFAQTKVKSGKKTKHTARPSYKLMIDFVSKGGGIDNDTYTKIETFANNHPKKPAFNVEQKGREGEKKMYFGLTELTEDEQYAFVDDVTKMIPDRKTVLIKSNLPKRSSLKTGPKIDVAVVPVTYRLIISFISKGAGLDHKAVEKLEEYAKNHPKKPVFDVKTWGREGEKDYLFMLKELNEDEQKIFVEEVKKLVSNSDMVFIKENEAYTKKGR